jgi:hypothetical protein
MVPLADKETQKLLAFLPVIKILQRRAGEKGWVMLTALLSQKSSP